MKRPPSILPNPALAARTRIVSAARGHFFATGFRRITMDDLADELGMSKKTLYAHFKSKEELIRGVLLQKFAEVELALGSIPSPAAEEFSHGVARFLACVREQAREIHPPFIRDLKREAPHLFVMVEERRRGAIQRHFKKLFDHGRKAGSVRKDIPPGVLMEILLGVTDAIVNPTKMLELGLAPEAAYSAVLSVVLEGVLTRPGRCR